MLAGGGERVVGKTTSGMGGLSPWDGVKNWGDFVRVPGCF